MLKCINHPKVDSILTCGKCRKPICNLCVADDSVGIKCSECIVVVRNPVYQVSRIRLVTCLVVSGVSVPGITWLWILTYRALVYIPSIIPSAIEQFIIPVMFGWVLGWGLSRLLNRKRSQYVFLAGSLAIVGGYVGVLLLAWSLMNVWSLGGICVAIYIMRHKVL